MSTKKIDFVVLYNPISGDKTKQDEFLTALREEYPQEKFHFKLIKITQELDLEKEISKAKKLTKNFVICGGDGTIRGCIQHLACDHDITVTTIPFGTFNHFASDAGQEMDPKDAIKAIMKDHIQLIDVGSVNGNYFVNNSSIGIYADMARTKQKWRHRFVGRWVATFIAAVKALHRFKTLDITAKIKGEEITQQTQIIFVGNNRYHLNPKKPEKVGTRTNLNEHTLHFFLLKKLKRYQVFSFIFRALRHGIREQNEFDEFLAQDITIHSNHRHIKSTTVSLDGEVMRLDFPLRYEIMSNALKIKTYTKPENRVKQEDHK